MLQLEESQSQAGKSLGVLRILIERLLIGCTALIPLLVPGRRMACAHRFFGIFLRVQPSYSFGGH